MLDNVKFGLQRTVSKNILIHTGINFVYYNLKVHLSLIVSPWSLANKILCLFSSPIRYRRPQILPRTASKVIDKRPFSMIDILVREAVHRSLLTTWRSTSREPGAKRSFSTSRYVHLSHRFQWRVTRRYIIARPNFLHK